MPKGVLDIIKDALLIVMITDKANKTLRSGQATVPLAKAMLLTAMAGGMGWGIRGQYGHETGAMIAGVLVASVLVMLFCSRFNTLSSARAIA